jgi:hypothetical protein
MRPLILAALLTALAPFATAQRIGHGASFHHPPHSPALLYYDPFYSDAFYHEPSPSTSQPPVILLQAPPPPPIPERPSPPTQPLMIELQNGRYVRISGEDTSTAETKQIDAAPPTRAPVSRRPGTRSSIAMPSQAPQQLPPAVLVFRDGRREEVSDYTIADGILYTNANYYTDGSWNKKIALSSLNLLDTIEANQSRGINFQFPRSPNEVIVRP